MSFLDIFKPSTWLKRKFRKFIEKRAGTYYEGPTPPRRLAERVKMFQLYYPIATPEQWAEFALTFGANCYREGFTRGYDWSERGWEGPEMEPEQVAELQAHDWSLAEENPDWQRMMNMGYDPRDPLAGHSMEQRRAIMETLNGAGQYPVEIDLSAYEGPPIRTPGFYGQGEEEDNDD